MKKEYVQITQEEFENYKELKKRDRKLSDHFCRIRILAVRLMILKEAYNESFFSSEYESSDIWANIDAVSCELNHYIRCYEKIINGADNDEFEPACIMDY